MTLEQFNKDNMADETSLCDVCEHRQLGSCACPYSKQCDDFEYREVVNVQEIF